MFKVFCKPNCVNVGVNEYILQFHGRHFVRHLGICNRICVKLLYLISGVTTHKHINKWLSYSQL